MLKRTSEFCLLSCCIYFRWWATQSYLWSRKNVLIIEQTAKMMLAVHFSLFVVHTVIISAQLKGFLGKIVLGSPGRAGLCKFKWKVAHVCQVQHSHFGQNMRKLKEYRKYSLLFNHILLFLVQIIEIILFCFLMYE